MNYHGMSLTISMTLENDGEQHVVRKVELRCGHHQGPLGGATCAVAATAPMAAFEIVQQRVVFGRISYRNEWCAQTIISHLTGSNFDYMFIMILSDLSVSLCFRRLPS